MEGPARHSQGSARVVSGFLFLKHVANIRPHFTTQEGLANSPFSVFCGNEEGDRGSRWPTRGLDAHAGMESSSLRARPQAGSGFCWTSAPKKLASPHHTVATLWSYWGQRWMVSALSLPCSLHMHMEKPALCRTGPPRRRGHKEALLRKQFCPSCREARGWARDPLLHSPQRGGPTTKPCRPPALPPHTRLAWDPSSYESLQ